MKKSVMAASAVMGMGALSAGAFEATVTPSVDVNFASAFVGGNGITWVDGPMLMPSASLGIDDKSGKHHTSFMYWAGINLDDTKGPDNPNDAQGEITEWDVFADYTYTGIEMVDLSAGSIFYAFPKIGGQYTTDVYIKAKLNVLLNPAATVLYDVDGSNYGFHGDIGISEGYDFECGASIGAWAKITWADSNYGKAYFSSDGNDYSGLMSYGAGLSASYGITEAVSLNAGLAYWKLDNDDGVLGQTYAAWDAIDTPSPQDNVVGNVSVGYTF
ncbi:hypothetical protein P4E94_06880 [Pontiellaceae bacterium B12219]|nr:hypothetical protein [Pontiellaceae bacterium B12219]